MASVCGMEPANEMKDIFDLCSPVLPVSGRLDGKLLEESDRSSWWKGMAIVCGLETELGCLGSAFGRLVGSHDAIAGDAVVSTMIPVLLGMVDKLVLGSGLVFIVLMACLDAVIRSAVVKSRACNLCVDSLKSSGLQAVARRTLVSKGVPAATSVDVEAFASDFFMDLEGLRGQVQAWQAGAYKDEETGQHDAAWCMVAMDHARVDNANPVSNADLSTKGLGMGRLSCAGNVLVCWMGTTLGQTKEIALRS